MKENKRTITHPLDDPLQSSARDFEAFINHSPIWADISMTLKERIEILTDKLIQADDDKEMYRLQQALLVLKEMLALPYYLMEHAELEQQIKDETNAKN